MGLSLGQGHLHYSRIGFVGRGASGGVLPGMEFLRQGPFQDDFVGAGRFVKSGDGSAPGVGVIKQPVEFFPQGLRRRRHDFEKIQVDGAIALHG